MELRKNLILSLKQQLDNNPLIIGLILVGSLARSKTDIYRSDKFSDLEAYVIVKNENVEKIEEELVLIVKKLGKVIFSYKNRWSGFSTVFDDLFRLELPVIKESEIPAVFSRPKAQPVKVLIDKTNGKLEESFAKRPKNIDLEKLFRYEVDDFWYMSIVASQYYKRGELYNTKSALHITTSSLIKFFEMLQDPKILLLETNKRIEQFLSKEQLSIIAELTPPYDKKAIGNGLIRSFDVFLNISKEISQKYGYDYNQTKELEIRKKLLDLLKNK